jgi:DNA (cytosine-5)-methyltransferase 1
MRAAGLFAGIGGIERGLEQAGIQSTFLCEIDPAAQAVLRRRFPKTRLVGDVADVTSLAGANVVCAGFPCQDLSQAGMTAGIQGQQSSVVSEVFRILGSHDVRWVVLENVPFMLSLARGEAMAYLTDQLQALGYRWAYRVIDAQAFGLPQRRQRVLLVASRDERPWDVLLAQDASPRTPRIDERTAYGFYWTEGLRGLGWAVDAVPTLKGGSTIGIPSPPAVLLPSGQLVVPDIRDAERLQGFRADWTLPAESVGRTSTRWKLVGNAVNVRVSSWLAKRLLQPDAYAHEHRDDRLTKRHWPRAAWFDGVSVRVSSVGAWPVARPQQRLVDFLSYPPALLSARATAGFLARAQRSTLRFQSGFLSAVARHLTLVRTLDGVPDVEYQASA